MSKHDSLSPDGEVLSAYARFDAFTAEKGGADESKGSGARRGSRE